MNYLNAIEKSQMEKLKTQLEKKECNTQYISSNDQHIKTDHRFIEGINRSILERKAIINKSYAATAIIKVLR